MSSESGRTLARRTCEKRLECLEPGVDLVLHVVDVRQQVQPAVDRVDRRFRQRNVGHCNAKQNYFLQCFVPKFINQNSTVSLDLIELPHTRKGKMGFRLGFPTSFGFSWVLLRLPGFIEFYWVLRGLIALYRVV